MRIRAAPKIWLPVSGPPDNCGFTPPLTIGSPVDHHELVVGGGVLGVDQHRDATVGEARRAV